jgi:hypothetical protein
MGKTITAIRCLRLQTLMHERIRDRKRESAGNPAQDLLISSLSIADRRVVRCITVLESSALGRRLGLSGKNSGFANRRQNHPSDLAIVFPFKAQFFHLGI